MASSSMGRGERLKGSNFGPFIQRSGLADQTSRCTNHSPMPRNALMTPLTVALAAVVLSLPAGLLGTPDMHVAGHNSYGNVLNWFADSSDSVLPVASVISLPLWVYKALILIWALWLSFALLRWLPWVWKCFSSDGYWRSRKSTNGDKATTESAA